MRDMTGTAEATAGDGSSDGSRLDWDMERDGWSLLPFNLLHPLRWEPTYDEENDRELLRIHLPHRDRWQRIQTHWEPVLEALADGEAMPEVAQRAADAMPDRPSYEVKLIVRKVTTGLLRLGMARVQVPEVSPILGDRFEVLEELGRGGMGVVWRCRDLEDHGREVAVKHAWNWGGRFESRERYLREEAERMEAFDHPAIVSALETFQHDGRFHLARDLVEGPSLKQLPRRGEFGPERRALRLRQAAEALIHIRDRGFLVLDIKTSNFRLDENRDQPTLMDLGLLETLQDGVAEARGFPGTRKYQDPYLMEATEADQRSSVFSLGKMLYEFVVASSPTPRGHYESYFEQRDLDLEEMAEAGATGRELALYHDACSPCPDDRPDAIEAFLGRLE